MYTQLATDLSQISPGDDLQWYALNFGTEMSYNWPEFEVIKVIFIYVHMLLYSKALDNLFAQISNWLAIKPSYEHSMYLHVCIQCVCLSLILLQLVQNYSY